MDSADSDFILWVIIQYYFIFLLKFSQVWPLRTLLVGSFVTLKYSHRCVVVVVWELALQVLHVSYSCLSIHPWSKDPSSFYWLMVLETKVWARDILVATRCHSFRTSQLTETRNTCVYSNLCVVGWKWSPPKRIKISTFSLWNLWMYIIWENEICSCD